MLTHLKRISLIITTCLLREYYTVVYKRCAVMDPEHGIAAFPHSFKECRTGMKVEQY